MADGNNKVKSFSRFTSPRFIFRKKWILIGVIALAVLGIILVFLFLMLNLNKKENVSEVDRSTTAIDNSISAKVDEVKSASGSKAALDYIDKELATSTTDTKKQSQLYLEKSIVSNSQVIGDDRSVPLQYAYKAESLSPDMETAMQIAILEEAGGNITSAIKYFKLYLTRLSSSPDVSDSVSSDYNYYSSHVDDLEASISK